MKPSTELPSYMEAENEINERSPPLINPDNVSKYLLARIYTS